jgi:hypothetical protein
VPENGDNAAYPPVPYVEVMDEVFDRLGGADGLFEWASSSPENLKEFYKLVAKRLPNEVVGDGGGPVLIQLKQV